MVAMLDRETVERLRSLPAAEALRQARNALYGSGPVGSEDFQDLYEQLVEERVLTWDQIDTFER